MRTWGDLVITWAFLLIVGGVIVVAVYYLSGCVQVVDKLPTLQERQALAHAAATRIEIWKRCVEVRHIQTEFAATGKEIPLELKQAKRICEEEN